MVLGGRPKIRALPQTRLKGKYNQLGGVGSGSFAEVHKVLNLETGAIYVKKEAILGNNIDAGFANEIATLEKLRHPNIVEIKEWGMDEGKLCIILEYVSGGSLAEVIGQMKEPMPEQMMRRIIYQCLLGLEYCHLHGVVHRDIKARNILMSDTGVVKLADFGGAKEAAALLKKGELLDATLGLQATLLWMAPELLKSRFNCQADIWSLGCTMIEMATGQKPWEEQNFTSIYAAIKFLKKVKTGPRMPQNLSSSAQAFLSRCFICDYTLRPTATELLQDPWFHANETGGTLSYLSPISTSSSESPQGPGASAGSSGSVSEVKFNVGDTTLSTQSSEEIDEDDEIANRNWIWALEASVAPVVEFFMDLPPVTGPDKLLSTMDFLSMKDTVDD